MREYWCWWLTLRTRCPFSLPVGCVYLKMQATHKEIIQLYLHLFFKKEGRDILCCYGLDIVFSPMIPLLKSWFSYVIALKSGGPFESWRVVERLTLVSWNGSELAEMNQFPPKQVWDIRIGLDLPFSCWVRSVLFFVCLFIFCFFFR